MELLFSESAKKELADMPHDMKIVIRNMSTGTILTSDIPVTSVNCGCTTAIIEASIVLYDHPGSSGRRSIITHSDRGLFPKIPHAPKAPHRTLARPRRG
jgi:hypothetical protein